MPKSSASVLNSQKTNKRQTEWLDFSSASPGFQPTSQYARLGPGVSASSAFEGKPLSFSLRRLSDLCVSAVNNRFKDSPQRRRARRGGAENDKLGPYRSAAFCSVYRLIALSCRRLSSCKNQVLRNLQNAKANKEVTREKFASFLEWLSPDSGSAGEEYERLRFRLCTFFAQRQCSFSDELADETINRVILKSSEEKIENKIAYCYGVARNVYRESLRKERTHLDIDDVTIAAKAPEEQSFSGECLDRCLAELSPETRNLLLDYFSEAKQAKIELHQRISDSLKMSQTALRMRIMRSKQKLKLCVVECMG